MVTQNVSFVGLFLVFAVVNLNVCRPLFLFNLNISLVTKISFFFPLQSFWQQTIINLSCNIFDSNLVQLKGCFRKDFKFGSYLFVVVFFNIFYSFLRIILLCVIHNYMQSTPVVTTPGYNEPPAITNISYGLSRSSMLVMHFRMLIKNYAYMKSFSFVRNVLPQWRRTNASPSLTDY